MLSGVNPWQRPPGNMQLANDLACKKCPIQSDQQAERSSFPRSFLRNAEVTGYFTGFGD